MPEFCRTALTTPASARTCLAGCRAGCGLPSDDREAWIDNRLRELAEIFSIAIGGFSVMDN
jgi:hypothetical protein